MAPPNAQPVLPPEGVLTDLEQLFITEQPNRLFPTNQNSNFGAIRKVLTDEMQEAVDKLTELVSESFIQTASGYLGLWEDQMGLPKAPTGSSDAKRRNLLLSRRGRAPFTRARLKKTVEGFILDTFGSATSFTPAGIPFDSSGITLFSGLSSLVGTYRIYENFRNFSYTVWITNTITPDIAGLTRELTWMTPSGISYTIDNAHLSVLRYPDLVLNSQPVGYWRMGTLNDSSGYGNGLTAIGGVVVGNLASPGLLNDNGVSAVEGATDLDGVDDNFSFSTAGLTTINRQVTIEAWVRPDGFATPGNYNFIIQPSSGLYLALSNGAPTFSILPTPGQIAVSAPGALTIGQTYHLVGTFDGVTMKIYVNGALVFTYPVPLAQQGALVVPSSTAFIGRWLGGAQWYFNGVLDEVAVYNKALSADVILDHYNTGRNIATY